MAEGNQDAQSTQQQDGAGEAKTESQIAADQKGAQGDGKQDGAGAVDRQKRSDDSGLREGDGGKSAEAGKKEAGTDGQDKKAVVPEKYDLKLSDGSLLDSKTVDKIAAIAREQGLSQEDAQKHLSAIETQAMQDRNERVLEWNKALETDKDLGGANHKATLASVQRYAGYLKTEYPDLLNMLEQTGYTSHPAVARFLRDQGNRMAEDKHEQPGSGQSRQKKAPLEERLYSKTTPKAA